MKKFLMRITSLVLLLSIALLDGACSCSSDPTLTFKNNFNDGKPVTQEFKETLEYSLAYSGDGTEYLELKKSTLTDQFIEETGINYSGTLVTTFEVVDKWDIPNLESDILSEENVLAEKISDIYLYRTSLNLTASYTFKDSSAPIVVQDTVYSEVYFLPETLSFAPIQSKYFADMHLVSVRSNTKLSRVQYQYSTVYNLDDFTITGTVCDLKEDGTIINSQATQINEGYSYKRAIDNNSLLFALRNFVTSSEAVQRLKVISQSYDEPTSLLLSAHVQENVAMPFGQAPSTEKLPVRNFSMNLNDQYTKGLSHYFSIQTAKSTTGLLGNNALLVKFAQPVYDYSTMGCLGALEFTLTSATHSGITQG